MKGGWIGYEYYPNLSSATTSTYKVTVYLYIDCHNTQSYTATVILGIFDAGTHAKALDNVTIPANPPQMMTKQSFSPCIVNQPDICYNVYTYSTVLTLPNNTEGYDLNVQFRARVDNIVNIYNSGNTGITLFTRIPGKKPTTVMGTEHDFYKNNSPQFNFLDTSVVCHNSQVAIPFSAEDPDGDSLSYSFGPGNDAGGNNNTVLVPPTAPPYSNLNYVLPYSGEQPLGSDITINPTTGLITGKAPAETGEYVVAVYAEEWRNGVIINITKKELQINVTDCSLESASLNPSYINCKDLSFTFKNNTTLNNATYYWDFGVPNDPNANSNDPNPTYEYPAAGTYTLKLKAGTSKECMDSTTAEINAYPGFFPGFDTKGNCILAASRFSDATVANNGSVNSWQWDFGDTTTSTEKNPTHQFAQPGDYKVTLLVGSSKGCSDTISHNFTVFNSLNLQPLFTDTTICYKDSVQLVVNSPFAQSYQWTPNSAKILNANTNTPLVYPETNTEYTLTAQSEDCIESVKVRVNLLKELNIVSNDLYTCIGDSATFNVSSLATKYDWQLLSGNDLLNNNKLKQPSLLVSGNNSYNIQATYGSHCTTEQTVQVLAAPYPKLAIEPSNDTTICIGNSIELNTGGTTTDNIWKTTNQTSNSITVKPQQTTTYIVDGYDRNSYCSKHVQDTIVVKIAPAFRIGLTRDTTIVLNQPLVLKPTTDQSNRNYIYKWSPSDYLNYSDSAIAIANIPKGVTLQSYLLNVKDQYGCDASARITVQSFQTKTDILVPSAFTPNNDGKNDIIRPILAGIKQFHFFKIFNRWGQLVYSTQTPGQGWNGYVNNQPQPTGTTFIYYVSAIDYNDKKIEKTGTIVIVR